MFKALFVANRFVAQYIPVPDVLKWEPIGTRGALKLNSGGKEWEFIVVGTQKISDFFSGSGLDTYRLYHLVNAVRNFYHKNERIAGIQLARAFSNDRGLKETKEFCEWLAEAEGDGEAEYNFIKHLALSPNRSHIYETEE